MKKPTVKKFSNFLFEGSSTEEQRANFSRNVLDALDSLSIKYVDKSKTTPDPSYEDVGKLDNSVGC